MPDTHMEINQLSSQVMKEMKIETAPRCPSAYQVCECVWINYSAGPWGSADRPLLLPEAT